MEDQVMIEEERQNGMIGKKIDPHQEIEDGMIEEVQSIREKKCNIDHIDYIGFSEISSFLDKDISMEDAIEKIHIRTRQYAKRQMKWFENNTFDSVFDMDNIGINDIVDKLVEMN